MFKVMVKVIFVPLQCSVGKNSHVRQTVPVFITEQRSNLLLPFTSIAVLGFGPCQDP
jgi:hypothetical protein